MSLAVLLLVFMRIGLLTIGGGLAALPLLYDEVVVGGWISSEEFADMLAISQSTPGPIGVNMATFVGYQAGTVAGALTATCGMVLPSIVIILLIARFVDDYERRPAVRHILSALRPTAIGLIAAAACLIVVSTVLNVQDISSAGWPETAPVMLFPVLLFAASRWPSRPVAVLFSGAVCGMLFF